MSRRPTARVWLAIALVALVGALSAHMLTARSEFCGSCHSAMGEHVASHGGSTHAEVAECLDCHSDPGWVGYYHSKLDGVRNALAYFFGVPKGQESPPPGPAACERPGCHEDAGLRAGGAGAVAHERHLGAVACVECHGDVGHRSVRERRMLRECDACHPPRESAGADTGAARP